MGREVDGTVVGCRPTAIGVFGGKPARALAGLALAGPSGRQGHAGDAAPITLD